MSLDTLTAPDLCGALDAQRVGDWVVRTYADPKHEGQFKVIAVNGKRSIHRERLSAHQAATFDPRAPQLPGKPPTKG